MRSNYCSTVAVRSRKCSTTLTFFSALTIVTALLLGRTSPSCHQHPSSAVVVSVSAFTGFQRVQSFYPPRSCCSHQASSRRDCIIYSFALHESLDSSSSTAKSNSEEATQQTQTQQQVVGVDNVELSQVNVLYGRRQSLVYDPTVDRYVSCKNREQPPPSLRQKLQKSLSVALLPAGVTPNYYRFISWRILQRFVNANLHVFGTQSLLMGLGIRSLQKSHQALSAALTWVLKDALGKLCRVWWASKMGRRFDADAKRWRFRASLLYSGGNSLEILTYLYPQFFLVFATCANSLKQISMLTASSTRTAIYNSFCDYKTQNIGDITAKGEAQIAIVDLLGIGSGVSISNYAIGTSAIRICILYAVLQVFEIICMYQQLRSVQYRVLNFERMIQVVEHFCDSNSNSSSSSSVHDYNSNNVNDHQQQQQQQQLISEPLAYNVIPTPSQLAGTERICLPPRRLARRANAFGSLSRARLSPQELEGLLRIFHRERFLLVVGANVKKNKKQQQPQQQQGGRQQRRRRLLPLQQWMDRHYSSAEQATRRQENCHIVLHETAENIDIVKSTLALALLRRRLKSAPQLSVDSMRSSECMDLIQDAYLEADRVLARFLRVMSKTGWESPARFMFGRVHMRAQWPLADTTNARGGGAGTAATNAVAAAAKNNVTRLTNGLQ